VPCPWYQHGLCTSPKLGIPTDAVVSPDRCLSNDRYRACAYYVETSKLNKQSRVRKEQLKIYAPIHSLLYAMDIKCPYAELMKLDNGTYVAYCHILDRVLTRFEAALCAEHWEKCPYRAIASTLRT